ncbi:hypothetical protein BGZ96_012650 [Linnemannia gamsii]|uniref:Methyltransferase domain-containing protein n=1 Tax=Linnemannia gamsii TaxID=64522 RepID=A0ABQ7JQ29_9FUNG|nr:hypothetical protein BGZ96_012650 [Linnemannia gamsii]
MGNVSSADQDKVNELLTRRAKKKFIASERKQRQQLQKQQLQQLKLSQDTLTSPHVLTLNDNSNGNNSSSNNDLDSLRQASFYSSRMATSPNSPRTSDSTSSYAPSIVSPTHTHYHYKSSSENSPLSPTVSATALSISASTTTTSLSTQAHDAYAPIKPPPSQGPTSPLPSSPVAIPRQNHSDNRYQRRENSLGTDSNGDGGPSVSPTRHDFDHNSNYRQQQQQLSADLRLLGTSPEAKDWLRQKPRSSAHMLHQYNFQSHQYYQPPGSVKIVNNTCRNMSGLPHVPNLTRNSTSTSTNISTPASPVSTFNGANKPSSAPQSLSKPRPNSITAAAAAMAAAAASQPETVHSHPNPAQANGSFDSPTITLPEHEPHFDGHFCGHGHISTPVSLSSHLSTSSPLNPTLQNLKKEPRVGRLVMSWSKLNTPSISSLSSAVSSSSSRLSAGSTPGSPIDQQTPDSSLTIPTVSEQIDQLATDSADLYEPPPGLRPSSTLSSLRSLFGNHPQGLSLIEALQEEDEEDGVDSLSDTESESFEPEQEASNGRLKTRRRLAPNFAWMEERKRLSAFSIPTISHSVHDSQKGQHALWKYIGGGNAHAPLRYDIDRILDSGCGLGEWAMEMAKEYPSATVYGVDLNPDLFPDMSQPVPSNCLFVQSNILSRLSFPDHYFDFVYQRFLYLGLTIDDWPVALKELRRVMKPGGWIELFEPCMRVHRAGPRTREVMRWISRLLQEERGLDFDFAGEKMKRLCESEMVGFQNVKLERLSIPVGAWGGRVGEAMAENMVLMFQNLQAALRESASYPRDAASAKAYGAMVQNWIRECEENKSYIDYYILVGQRALE